MDIGVGNTAGTFDAVRSVLTPERLVDIYEDLLLSLAETLVGEDCGHHFSIPRTGLENSRANIELFGRDPETLGDLLQDVRARFAESSLDLREVRVRDAGEPGELTQRNLSLLALLTDELSDRGTSLLRLLFWPLDYHLTSVRDEC